MNEQQWQKAKQIFVEAAELTGTQRAAYVVQAAQGDAVICAQVENMLAADSQSHSLVDVPDLFWAPEASVHSQPTTIEPQSDLPFDRIKHYRLLRLLGQGGMGEVYAAWDEKMGRNVALKLMKAGLPEQYLKRFDEERRLLARLNHPNIVTIYDSGQINERPYFVMEFLTGQSLRDRLSQGALPSTEWLNLSRQTCTALNAAHSQGVIHRDIKPDNIFLAQNADGLLVKVLDFGIAAWRESETITQTLQVVGTSAYISPEQAVGKSRREIDQRADIYSLGVVVYEMMSGERPFTASQPAAYLHLHANVVPAKPSERNRAAGISPALDAVVMRALEKNPAARFDSARAFAEALQAALEKKSQPPNAIATASISYDTQVRAVETDYLAPETQPISSPKPKWPYAAAAVLLIALALGGWFAYRQLSSPLISVQPAVQTAQPKVPTPIVVAPTVTDALNLERFRKGVGKVSLTDTVRSRDHIYFQVTPPHAGWLSLVQAGTKGDMNVVYVHPKQLQAAQPTRLPEMAFDRIEGEEKLYFVFTKAPGDLAQVGLSGARQPGTALASAQVVQLESLAAQPGLSATVVVRKVVLQHQR